MLCGQMKASFVFFCTFALGLVAVMGCVTTNRVNKANSGRMGVQIEVLPDGTLKLFGNPIARNKLVKRLIKEEKADRGRAVILEAKGNVRLNRLEDLREFFVSNRIPNVIIVTPRNAYSYEEGDPDAMPAIRK